MTGDSTPLRERMTSGGRKRCGYAAAAIGSSEDSPHEGVSA
jgi:hypothetical protein